MTVDREQPLGYADLRGDLAGRYHPTPTAGAQVDDKLVDADLAALDRDGYLIWEGLLDGDECAAIRAEVSPLLGHTGRNSFEGNRTQRAYGLLNKTRLCDRLVEHPRVLAVLDRLLLPNYLLSILQAINIQPGESAQLLHVDDGFYPVPRPHRRWERQPSGRSTTSPKTTAPPSCCRAASAGAAANRAPPTCAGRW